MGGHHLIAKDFHGPDKEDNEVRRSLIEKTKDSAVSLVKVSQATIAYSRNWRHALRKGDAEASSTEQEKSGTPSAEDQPKEDQQPRSKYMHFASESGLPSVPPSSSFKPIPKRVTFNQDDSTVASEAELPSRIASPLPTTVVQGDVHFHSTAPSPLPNILPAKPSPGQLSRPHRLFKKTMAFLWTLLTVPTMAVVTAFIISVIQPLKGLFVLLPSSPKAPDGQPPLAFILDSATFLGGASVPLGLICLGSALARLKVPRSEWRNLPMGSIMGLAVGRMVVQPVLGVLLVQGLTQAGIISVDDKVLRFVCM
jgi:predicted permease